MLLLSLFFILSLLFSCLLLSCLSSSVFSSLSLSLSSFSVSVCLCLFLRVMLCVMLCVILCCVVVCRVWLAKKKKPCVHSTRLRVHVQNGPVCTGTTRTHVETHVRLVPVHTGTFWTCTRRRFFIGTTSDFWHFLCVLNGCWVHLLSTMFCLPWMAHMGYHVLQRFTKETLESYTLKVWE